MNHEVLSIADPAGGAVAKIVPGRGFNCISFQVEHAGEWIETLWTAPDFVSGEARPASSGIPILFPFAGRLGGTSFTFEGRRYELEPGDSFGNAIHGFVFDRAWEIAEHIKDRLIGGFKLSRDAPERLHRWPADFELVARYQIVARRLLLEITVKNVGDGPLPFGLGIHPYFRVPLGNADRTNAAACRMTVPVEECWELKDMLPTGRTILAQEAGLPREGVDLGHAKFDDVFSGVTFQDGWACATVHDPRSGRTTRLMFDEPWQKCVVYTPGHREAVCIEPYTCLPDAYRLREAGCDTGLEILQPGETFRATMRVEVVTT